MTQPDSTESSLGDMLRSMPQRVSPNQLAGIDATVQIRSVGAATDEWYLTFKDSVCTVQEGATPAPSLTVEAAADVWQSLVQRRLDAGWAFMSGQIRVSGDLGLAMRLQSVLGMG